MNAEKNAHTALRAVIAGLVFCTALAGFFHATPVHSIAATTIAAPVIPASKPMPAANCLPSGNGGPCIPFGSVIRQMEETPDPPLDAPEPIPANPAAKNLERI